MKKNFIKSHESLRLVVFWMITLLTMIFLFPTIMNFILTGQIPIGSDHITKSNFWLGMSVLAVFFIAGFTLLYWYIREHHDSDE